MSFATPLLLLLLPLALAFPLWRWWRPASRPTLAVADLGLLAAARGDHIGWRVRLRWLPTALRVAAVALLIVALARPQRGQGSPARAYTWNSRCMRPATPRAST